MSPNLERLKYLRETLTRYSYQYYVLNCSPVTDAEFDQLYRELLELERQFPQYHDDTSPTQRIGAKCTGFAKVKHADKMLSLENTFTAKEVIDRLGVGREVSLEPKVDGASLRVSYRKGKLLLAATRGDGFEGDDVTNNARSIVNLPLKLTAAVDITVKGEVYMTYSTFNQLNARLEKEGKPLKANPRNAAAGALKLLDPKQVAEHSLRFVAYGWTPGEMLVSTQQQLTDYLECLGFQSVYWLPVTQSCSTVADCFKIESEEQLARRIEEADRARQFLDLPTDGLVFKVNSLAEQDSMGAGNKYPNWACAYKFPPERKTTRLKSITVQIGRTGKLTPVAELEPVYLSGSTVSRATICNQDEINRLGLNVGDDVYVEKAAEIIPNVVGVSGKNVAGVFQLPTSCPCCASKLSRPQGLVDTYCLNPDCKEQVIGRLRHAASKQALDIDGCGEALITQLYAHGVRTISQLFTVDPVFLKPAAQKRFLAGRAAVASKPFWRKLHALGIEGIGQTLSMELADQWPCLADMFKTDADVSKLTSLVGPVAVQSIMDYVLNNAEELDALDSLIQMSGESRADGPLTGKTFCITGHLSISRSEAAERIRAAGGTWKNSVSSKTDYLVVGDVGAGADKLAGALKFRVPKLTEEQLWSMLGTPAPSTRIGDTIDRVY